MILVPYVELNGSRTISDDILISVFNQTKEDGIFDTVFYEGNINTEQDFISIMKSANNYPVFIFDEDKTPLGYAWLNGLGNNHAFAHFCYLKRSWGKHTQEFGSKLLKYWFSFPGEEGLLFDVILGNVPDFNKHAHKYIEKLGFKKVGEIPKMCINKSSNRKSSYYLYYYLREDHGQE